MRAVLAILMMVTSALLSACTTTRGPDPALVARIEFPQPKGWVVSTRQEMLSKPYWKRSYTDYGIKWINKNKDEPIYYYSKYPEPADFLNPSIVVNISKEKTANFMDADVALDMLSPLITKMLKSVEPIEPARKTTISGFPAAEMTVRSDAYLSDGRQERSVTLFRAVRVDGWFIVIAAERRADEKLVTEAEMMRIVNSIRIRPATP